MRDLLFNVRVGDEGVHHEGDVGDGLEGIHGDWDGEDESVAASMLGGAMLYIAGGRSGPSPRSLEVGSPT